MIRLNRGSGSGRGIYFGAVGALAIALSGCGGGSAGSSAMPAAAAQASSSIQQSVPAQGSTVSQGPTTSQGAPPPAGGGSSTTGTSSGSGSTGASPPTASIGNVTLNWMPPTENVDGSPLTNLAGYDIHYGTTSGNYTQTIKVSNPGIATYVVSNLTPGTYYFSVSAVNATGTESPMSREVSTTVN